MKKLINMNFTFVVIVLILFNIFTLFAQDSDNTRKIEKSLNSGNKYQESFLKLSNELKTRHPGMLNTPLLAMSMEKFEKITQETYQKLSDVNNRRDFFFIVSLFLSEFNDGHSNLFYSPIDKRIIPFSLTWIGDRLFVSKVFNPNFSSFLGNEVLKIADYSTSEFEMKVNKYRQTDKDNLYHLRREQFGSNFFIMLYDTYNYLNMVENDSIRFTLKNKDITRTISVPFGGMEDIKEDEFFVLARNEITKCTYKNHYSVIDSLSTLYFQMGMDKLSSETIKKIFMTIKEQKLKNLVIDLRNSGGGSASEDAVEFFKYLIHKTGDYWGFKGWMREEEKNISVTENNGKIWIEKADEELLFEGQVVLFTGGKTFSSSALFAMMVRDNKFGEIWGEPCGSNVFRYGKKTVVPMPKVEMAATFSTTIWNSANPDNKNKFIEPDKLIYQTIDHYISGKDALWEYYLNEIDK